MRAFALSALFAGSLFAQNAANFLVSPQFQARDNNGNALPQAQLCAYYAGTNNPANLYADAGGITALTQPITMNGGGQAQIYGAGNYKLVLSQPASTSIACPADGAVIWTMDNVFIYSQNPSFTNVTATTYTSTATGATNAFVVGNYGLTGAGDLTAGTVRALTTFISNATGTTPAITVNSGSWEAFGNGNTQGQTAFYNQLQLTGYAGNPSCAACTSPVAGSAFISYNTTKGALQYNLGGAGWITFSVPSTANGIVYVSGGALTNSSAFTYSGGNVTLTGALAAGQIGSSYSSSANTDLAGTLTLSGGTIVQTWPSGRTYSATPVCMANDSTGVQATSAVPSTTGLTINGNGTDVVEYLCAFTQF